EKFDGSARAHLEICFGLGSEIEPAVNGEGGQCEDSADDGVPIQNARGGADAPVGPERKEEVGVGADGDAADDVGEGGPIEDGEQDAGKGEERVEEGAPDAEGDVAAEFDADAAEDEQPEHDHEGEIEAAERG